MFLSAKGCPLAVVRRENAEVYAATRCIAVPRGRHGSPSPTFQWRTINARFRQPNWSQLVFLDAFTLGERQ